MTDQPRTYLDPLHDELDRLRTELATVTDTLHRRTQSHAALVRTRLACPTCSTLPLEETPGE